MGMVLSQNQRQKLNVLRLACGDWDCVWCMKLFPLIETEIIVSRASERIDT